MFKQFYNWIYLIFYVNIYEDSFNKDKTKNEFKSDINHSQTQNNSLYNTSRIRNYINIQNLNINKNLHIYEYSHRINNHEFKKLNVIERNNIINAITTSSDFINPKSYIPIYYKLFPSYINSGKNKFILYKNKNNQKDGNSIQLNSTTNKFKTQENLSFFSIQNFFGSSRNNVRKTKLYKSKGLKNNGFTKLINSNLSYNI